MDNLGYKQVTLYKNGKQYRRRVHRLVALTYIENDDPSVKNQVNHIDGNKLNNNINNLEWVTNAQNTQHAYDNNLYKNKKRSHRIKAMCKNTNESLIFSSIREAANILDINRKTLTAILKNERNNNYNYIFEYLK